MGSVQRRLARAGSGMRAGAGTRSEVSSFGSHGRGCGARRAAQECPNYCGCLAKDSRVTFFRKNELLGLC